MPVSKRPPCRVNHKSFAALAKCVWPWADIQGEGPHAVCYPKTSPYTRLLIRLYPTREMADEEIRVAWAPAVYRELFMHPRRKAA